MLAATGDAGKFIPGHTLGVHLNDIWGKQNKMEENLMEEKKLK